MSPLPGENALKPLLLQQSRLLQLASAALPVGGFSYSQGLEAAQAAGVITDAADAEPWIAGLLERFQARCEAPLWLIAYQAFRAGDSDALLALQRFYIASRETAALRDETRQMGWSLAQLALGLGWFDDGTRASVKRLGRPAYPLMFAGCAHALHLPAEPALAAYLFAWLEGQCIGVQKLLPIGQSAGQRMLYRLATGIPDVVARAVRRAAEGASRIETFAPHLSILAARHETQYSRLFRT